MSSPPESLRPKLRPVTAAAFKDWSIVLLVLTIVFVAFVRWRIADTPLERDEGEFAYGGQLIRAGEVPYPFLYNIKLPGTYAAYALIMSLYGETPFGIHLGLLFVNLASIALIYLLGKKLSSPGGGAIAATIFAILTLSSDLLGFAAHATHFVVLAALSGFYFLFRSMENKRPVEALLSGICMGISFLCKQPGLFFGMLAFAFLSRTAIKERKPILCAAYFGGWIAPYLFLCAILLLTGSFAVFWRWTVIYAAAHQAPLSGVPDTLKSIWNGLATRIHIIIYGFVVGLGFILSNKKAPTWKRIFLGSLAAASSAGVVLGFYFYRHYFVLLAPALGLVIGVAATEAAAMLRSHRSFHWCFAAPIVAVLLWPLCAVIDMRQYLFLASPDVIIGAYKGNPFLASQVVGTYLAAHCPPQARIAVLESEPEILFYAHRKSATGYIYAYDMTAITPYRTEMQEEFKREVTEAKPEYVVFVSTPYAWTARDQNGFDLYKWCSRFTDTNYQTVGVVDQAGPSLHDTISRWDAEAASYTNRSLNCIEVYRRIPQAAK